MSSVNHKIRSIFVHIPKCAGSSMSSLSWNRGNHHDSIYTICTQSSGTLASGQKAIAFDPSQYFKWTFVRNPWDRLVSAYEASQETYVDTQTGQHRNYRYGYPFAQLVADMWEKRSIFEGRTNFELIDAWREENFDLNGLKKVHLVPQHLFLEIDGELAVDFIGRYENITEDFQHVCRVLNQDFELPWLYKTDGQGEKALKQAYRSYYTQRSWDMVAEIYVNDIELFGYGTERL